MQADSDSDGLLSPLHSIFDFDGSDTKSSTGLVSTPLHAFLFSFTMIIISELGDKTFLIAALMAMRHPRAVVFSAAFASLVVMTVLSASLGHAVPHLSICPPRLLVPKSLIGVSPPPVYVTRCSWFVPCIWRKDAQRRP